MNIPELLEGMEIRPLREIADDRGAVLHMFRVDPGQSWDIAEVYFSEVNPGIVKGWKRHREMTQRYAVPVGRIRFAFHDDRPESNTRDMGITIELGRPDAYSLLVVPPRIWYAFKGLGSTPSLIANCADRVHDPDEVEQMSLEEGTAGGFLRW